MTIRNEKIFIEKLQFYKDNDEAVHLVLKNNQHPYGKNFRNGLTKEIKLNSIIFNDEVLGVILIYLSELIDVAKRKAKR